MVHLVLGATRSGKSLYAERELASRPGRSLYVATLPPIALYMDIIECHRRRRPSGWSLVELIGEPREDHDLLLSHSAGCDNAVLDGLSFYITRVLTIEPWRLASLARETIGLLQVLSTLRNLLLVDAPCHPSSVAPVAAVISAVHCQVIATADRMTYVENGIARSLTRSEACGICGRGGHCCRLDGCGQSI